MTPTGITYYDRPVLKPPVWIWTVPAYFFVGGVAGAAMTLGLAVQAVRRGRVCGASTSDAAGWALSAAASARLC